MKKDKEDKEEYPFPEGYEYIGDIVSEARTKIEYIDKQLDRTPRTFEKPKPFVPRYNPPGFLQPARPTNPMNVIYDLEQQKTAIERQVNWRVERTIEAHRLDEQTAGQLREATFNRLHPNPFDGKSELEMKWIRKQEKDINYSQEYMRWYLSKARAEKAEKVATKTEPEPAVEKEQPAKPTQPFSISARFTQSLSYTKVQTGKSPETPGKDKDTPGKE